MGLPTNTQLLFNSSNRTGSILWVVMDFSNNQKNTKYPKITNTRTEQ